MVAEKMSSRVVEYFSNFSDYYQKTLLRRLIVGLIIGSILWLSLFLLSNILAIILDNNIWWDTFLYDLPLVGAIIALIVTLQIWGILPQPANTEDDHLFRENIGNEEHNKEEANSEESELD
ncbi:MAG: hypothetical protein JSW11_16530 [Candidatus Heimdallarchaeota archaeon]|nr:MAG: hypothetical protein JSW11_16530 [Candidatus Heimdallarchaeota archaeon]